MKHNDNPLFKMKSIYKNKTVVTGIAQGLPFIVIYYRCSTCKRDKKEDDFHNMNRVDVNGDDYVAKQAKCKECTAEYNKEYRIKKKKKVHKKTNAWNFVI